MAAARKPSLRAVKTGEKPPPRRPARAKAKTVAQAAASGNHRELLVAMRDRVAAAVSDSDCPPRDLAALTRRLQDVAKEIEALDLRAKEEAAEGGVTEDEDWNAEAL